MMTYRVRTPFLLALALAAVALIVFATAQLCAVLSTVPFPS
jgi:hypothetical protein